jgi:predicted RNA binding protein YcfA (HicA-like mRNA interferase family)
MNSRDLIAILKNDGWQHVRTAGSHWQFKHSLKKGIVTVPHPKKDLPSGTVNSVLKQSKLKNVKL